jgi:sugar phosphate isomerase/epimerase
MTDKLMNLYWSSCGLYPGDGEISPFDFEARVKSAARAGFAGFSFWHTDLEAICKTRPLAEMRHILDDNGLSTFEVEFIEDWFVDGERRAASDKRRQWLLEVAGALDAHHVKVGDFRNTPVGMPRLIDEFATLCADAAKHGATIGFEFMKSAMIHELDDCLALVEGAGAANGGLIVDIAHTNALGINNAHVAAIPGRYMISVELGDNHKRTTPGYDPGARRWCGEGELDVPGFIAAARATGYAGPWAVEVFNRAHKSWPLERLDETAYRTTAQFVK